MIRAATPDDAAAIAAIYAPHCAGGEATFELDAPDAAEIARRMAASEGLYPWLVAEQDGAVLGYAYAGRFRERAAYRWVVETAIYVADAAHGRGVGRRLYETLLATLTAQGFTSAIGVVSLPNPASVALHEAVGFRCTGVTPAVGYKLGRWIDVGWWQCALAKAEVPPAEPRRFVDTEDRIPSSPRT